DNILLTQLVDHRLDRRKLEQMDEHVGHARSSYPPAFTRLELFSLPGGGDVEDLAVLGDGAPGQVDALLFELVDDLIVVEGIVLVFVVDDELELFLDRVPAHLFALGAGGASGEEAAQGEDAARG